ncbi:MAG TPA: aquaporin, partial [Chitinophagales bacterium]|nr:aquaporin [Chitinophagales bacterium]
MASAFKQNWTLYLMESAGLAFFMISACFFGGILWSDHSAISHWITSDTTKLFIMGMMMGVTALAIFYSPFTNKSGAQINPAVTITFLRLGRMGGWDSLFYIVFQFIGGTLAVYLMKLLMGKLLTDPAVNYVVTVPGKYGMFPASVMEFCTAFIMMMMVLITSAHKVFRKYTRLFAASLVCTYVMIAGPVSGFGMNP